MNDSRLELKLFLPNFQTSHWQLLLVCTQR